MRRSQDLSWWTVDSDTDGVNNHPRVNATVSDEVESTFYRLSFVCRFNFAWGHSFWSSLILRTFDLQNPLFFEYVHVALSLLMDKSQVGGFQNMGFLLLLPYQLRNSGGLVHQQRFHSKHVAGSFMTWNFRWVLDSCGAGLHDFRCLRRLWRSKADFVVRWASHHLYLPESRCIFVQS